MQKEKIILFPEKSYITLTAFLPEKEEGKEKKDALLIIPGGAYREVSVRREGDAIAETFTEMGVRCFVLKYSVGENARFPTPLEEASASMVYIKKNAEKYGIDPNRIFVIGFSAGGHLAASLGTLWHEDILQKKGMAYGDNRPCGMILSYGVLCYGAPKKIGSDITFAHVFGTESPSPEEIVKYSLEKQVKKETTVPAFLWHTVDDNIVSVENTLQMTHALCKEGVYNEAHIFPKGPHGIALATALTADGYAEMINQRIAVWPHLVREWMKTVK